MSIFSATKLYEVKEVNTTDSRRVAIRYAIQDFPKVTDDQTIGNIEKYLITHMDSFKTVNYIFVTNQDNKLTGVLSIKELFRQPKDSKVTDVMTKDIISVKPTYTRERVTYVALRHQLKDIPVVDEDHKLLGVIPYDMIYSLAYKESREDLMKFAGLRHPSAVTENILEEPVFRAVVHRIPWLLIGLVGGLGAAGIIDSFESTLQKNLILASFIPMIVYMSDAVRTQLEAFIIRDLAVNPKFSFGKYFFKQFSILTFIALISSLTLYFVSLVLYRNSYLSLTLGIALTAAIFSSLFTGLLVPKVFSKLKMDPANASGPIGTIIQDIMSVVIYLTVATLLL